jgi:hypothetical protein
MNRKLQLRTESARGLVAYSNEAPPTLDKLRRDGLAEDERIRKRESIVRREAKEVLVGWLNQSQRLYIAAEIHGLKGPKFLKFAADIGIARSTAYEVLKLHPHQVRILTLSERTDFWPNWQACLHWVKNYPADDDEPVDDVVRECEADAHWRVRQRRTGAQESPITLAAERAKREELEAELAAEREKAAALREQRSRRNQGSGSGYILTPPDLIPTKFRDFPFDFDPCPHPLPPGWDGLRVPWGRCNLVNMPWRKRDDVGNRGPTAYIRRGIEERRNGNTSVFFIPTNSCVHLLAEAGAEMRPLGRVPWLHRETSKPWPNPDYTTAFILHGLK